MKVLGRRLSFRMRLTAWLVSVLAITLVIFGVVGYFGLWNYLKVSLEQSYRSTGRVIAQSFLQKIPVRGETWAVEQIQQAYPAAKTQRLVRISAHGRVLYQTGPRDDVLSIFRSIPLPLKAPDRGVFERIRGEEQMFLHYTQEYHVPGGDTYEIEVVGSLAIMSNTLHFLLKTYLFSTPVILVLAGVGGLALMKRPLAPLLLLTAKADSIGKNGLGKRLPVEQTGDELQSLAISLNRMIGRLEEALAHNRRFSADASHELRTPLSILRGEMEEMLRFPDLPERAVGNTISAIEEIERMSHIVQSLMDITRLDAGGERLHLQHVNLTVVAQTTVDQMRLLADASEIPLTLEAPAELMIVADPFRVKQVLVNLIDNAIKYTPEGDGSREKRSIAVRVLSRGDSVFMEVEDHGIGIPAEALPLVFDRFYRAEESRNRRAGGSGLGLAIVKAIVAAHQGMVSAHSVEGKGSLLRVILPLSLGSASAAEQDSSRLVSSRT